MSRLSRPTTHTNYTQIGPPFFLLKVFVVAYLIGLCPIYTFVVTLVMKPCAVFTLDDKLSRGVAMLYDEVIGDITDNLPIDL